MPQAISRAQEEALRNLKLDASFFQRILAQEAGLVDDTLDYDVYLMERGLMPVLLQGLDALARHVEKLSRGGGLSGGSRAPFNPLTWLAQYLLRNHPGKVKDHRSPMYEKLAELASIERGRRSLLRRRQEMEAQWNEMGEVAAITPQTVPQFLRALDDKWGLDGEFARKLPADFTQILEIPEDTGLLPFEAFWDWFEGHVLDNDVLRVSAFEGGVLRREEAARLVKEEAEEQVKREKAMQKVLELRRALEEEFASICADLYTNDVITRIINKGAVITGVVEQEGGPSLIGVHIELIISMMRLWGCHAESDDVWNEAAMVAWQQWLDAHGPPGCVPQVDSVNLRALMDRDAFEAYVLKVHTAEDEDLDQVVPHHAAPPAQPLEQPDAAAAGDDEEEEEEDEN